MKTLRLKLCNLGTLKERGHAIWETACQNAAYLAAIAIWDSVLELTPGAGLRFGKLRSCCDLGGSVAKTLRFCVCVWKATKHTCSVASFPAMTQESPGSVNPFFGPREARIDDFLGPMCVVAEFVLINGFYTRILL